MNLRTVSEPSIPQKVCLENDQSVTIRLAKVGVRYRVPNERIFTFKEYMIRVLERKVHHESFWALQDVSLEVRQGQVFGLIGNNGAGKSTLLKLVARVLKPTSGRVWVRGRVAPLLEFGAAFHLDLTGRENIFLNGSLLGFTQDEMEEKFARIVAFAELESFIDAPMRTYSSGMWARLGFAVATDVNPDVLIIDEVLSVGDEAFQKKCLDRIQEFRDMGAAIFLVSHNMNMIDSMCDQVAWLDHGHLRALGQPDEVIQAYRSGRG